MKKLYLHVGVGKTGSTAIQHALSVSKRRLRKHGYLYPTSLGVGHAKMAQVFRSDEAVLRSPFFRKQTVHETPAELRASTLAEFSEEVASSSAESIVVVNETLFSLPEDQFDEMLRFFKGVFNDITLIFFVRRQDEMIVSSFKQGIIQGATNTLDQFVRYSTQKATDKSPPNHLDYASFLDRVSDRHPDITLRTALYNKTMFEKKSLLDTFATLIDLPEAVLYSEKGGVRNKSLDAACAEYLRLYNASLEGELAPAILIRCLKKLSSKQDYVLSSKAREAIFSRFRDGNLRVATVYLKQGGELLAAPMSQEPSSGQVTEAPDIESLHFKVIGQLCKEHEKQVTERKTAWGRFAQVEKQLESLKSKARQS
ncbi:MAG: hypothetical protein RIG84_05925 [Roseovarius sp.]